MWWYIQPRSQGSLTHIWRLVCCWGSHLSTLYLGYLWWNKGTEHTQWHTCKFSQQMEPNDGEMFKTNNDPCSSMPYWTTPITHERQLWLSLLWSQVPYSKQTKWYRDGTTWQHSSTKICSPMLHQMKQCWSNFPFLFVSKVQTASTNLCCSDWRCYRTATQ